MHHYDLTKHQKAFIREYARLKEKYPTLYIRYQDMRPRGFYYYHTEVINGVETTIQHDISFYLANPDDGGDKPLHSRTILALVTHGHVTNINRSLQPLDTKTMHNSKNDRYIGFILKQDVIDHVLNPKIYRTH